MSAPRTPDEIFQRAVEEGARRLDQTTVELLSTSFIAGFTIVFGVAAAGIAHAAVEPVLGPVAGVVAALAFAPALVFLVVGRTELFNENFFDPTAAAVVADDDWLVGPLLRLWVLTFAFNFAGVVPLTALVAVDGTLPGGAPDALAGMAVAIAHRTPTAAFASAVVGGALVALLSFLLQAVDGASSRIALAYLVGFLLALGPFDHVVVTVSHVYLGTLFGAPLGYRTLFETMAVATAGNLAGGLGLVTLSHVARVEGSDGSAA